MISDVENDKAYVFFNKAEREREHRGEDDKEKQRKGVYVCLYGL
jgi:hypothetical protein